MKRRRIDLVVLAIATVIAAMRCAAPLPRQAEVHASSDISSSTPVIDSARPDSVLVPYGGVVEVTLHGKGFVPGKPGRNTVHFDGTALKQVAASADGKQLVFVVPDLINRGGEAPPMRLQGGDYHVSIETMSGISNAVTVRVYR